MPKVIMLDTTSERAHAALHRLGLAVATLSRAAWMNACAAEAQAARGEESNFHTIPFKLRWATSTQFGPDDAAAVAMIREYEAAQEEVCRVVTGVDWNQISDPATRVDALVAEYQRRAALSEEERDAEDRQSNADQMHALGFPASLVEKMTGALPSKTDAERDGEGASRDGDK